MTLNKIDKKINKVYIKKDKNGVALSTFIQTASGKKKAAKDINREPSG